MSLIGPIIFYDVLNLYSGGNECHFWFVPCVRLTWCWLWSTCLASYPLFQDVGHFRTDCTGSSSDAGTLEVGKVQKSWTLCFLPPRLSHFPHRNPIRRFSQAQGSSGSNPSGFFLTSARQLGCAIFLGEVFPALSSDKVGLICLPCSRRIFHPIVFPFKKSPGTFFRKAQAGTTVPAFG